MNSGHFLARVGRGLRRAQDRTKLTGLEIGHLKNFCDKHGIDWEMEIDPNLTYWENKENLERQFLGGSCRYHDYEAECAAYNAEQCRAYNEEQAHDEPEPLAPLQIVPRAPWFRKVYVQAGGQWLPIWVKQAPAVVIEIPVVPRAS